MLACKKRLKRKYIILCSKKSNITRYLHFLRIQSDSCASQKIRLHRTDNPFGDCAKSAVQYRGRRGRYENVLVFLFGMENRNHAELRCTGGLPFLSTFLPCLKKRGPGTAEKFTMEFFHPRWRRDRENRPRRKLTETKD